MTKIDSFSRANYDGFEQALKAAMDEVAAKFGVTIEIAKARVTSTEASIVVRAQSALGDQIAAKTWDLLAEQFGYRKGQCGKQFVFQGKVFTALSLSAERVKYPMTAEAASGKRYKFGTQSPSIKWLNSDVVDVENERAAMQRLKGRV